MGISSSLRKTLGMCVLTYSFTLREGEGEGREEGT